VSYTVLISVLIIGCGSYQPIEQYITSTSSPYPVYANPSLSLYRALEFKSSFTDKAKDDPEKDYMVGQGSTVSRVLGGVKSALGDLGNFGNQGPMAQNGGEVIMTPGESNATIQKMANASISTGCRIRWIIPISPRYQAYSVSSLDQNDHRQTTFPSTKSGLIIA
jgi:hypothetical protein